MELKATPKNVWLPLGVVVALLLATVGAAMNYSETRSTAFAADSRSIKNELELNSLKEELLPAIASMTTELKNLNANFDELKKK